MLGRFAIALLLLAVAAPALAGRVYRCDSGEGGVSYSSKRVPGAQCRLVGSYAAKASKPVRQARAKPAVAVAVEPERAPAGGVPPAKAFQTAAASAPVAVPPPATPAPASPAPAVTAPRLVRGQVYSFVGKDGVRNYSSVRPAGVSTGAVRTIHYSYMETCYACGAQPGLNFRTLRLNTVAYQDEIRAAARLHGVEEAIVRAIIHAESAFNPNALSRVGAQGLMQLMPATARRFGVSNAFDASQNIGGGVKYLAWLLKRFNGNLTMAAAGYNAGEGAVDKYGGVPPYGETQRYVQRVALLAERYRGVLNPVAMPLQGGLSAR